MSALPKVFRDWHRERKRSLVRAGVDPGTAKRLSMREAKGRARAAHLAGEEAALAGTLFFKDLPDGTTRFLLAMPPDLIPADRREAVRSFFAEEQPPGARH